jgi:predicted DNA-binding transcriptional regulator AlpA
LAHCPAEKDDELSTPQRAAPPTVPPIETLLVDARQAAAACGIGRATWFRLKSRGMTPAPVKLAGRVLYRAEELRHWVAMGCPDRKTFEARMAAGGSASRPKR